jgi:hypothetical protein
MLRHLRKIEFCNYHLQLTFNYISILYPGYHKPDIMSDIWPKLLIKGVIFSVISAQHWFYLWLVDLTHLLMLGHLGVNSSWWSVWWFTMFGWEIGAQHAHCGIWSKDFTCFQQFVRLGVTHKPLAIGYPHHISYQSISEQYKGSTLAFVFWGSPLKNWK